MTQFTEDELLDAFDQIAEAAILAGQRLELVVYGGSALMLAGNFRYSTEDVDIAQIADEWPQWLMDSAARIAKNKGWSHDWLNDAVAFHLSPLAELSRDHVVMGTFPRGGGAHGLIVHVPNADYMLALKLKAMRLLDPAKGTKEISDIVNLMRVVGVKDAEEAIAILAKFFPNSAASAEKQRFLFKNLIGKELVKEKSHAPVYPRTSGRASDRGPER
jgi:hypothetical protein